MFSTNQTKKQPYWSRGNKEKRLLFADRIQFFNVQKIYETKHRCYNHLVKAPSWFSIFLVKWLKRMLMFDVSRLVSTEAHLCCLSLLLKQPLCFYLPAGSYDWSESGFVSTMGRLVGSVNSLLFRLFGIKSLRCILLNISWVNLARINGTKRAIAFYLNYMQIIIWLSFSQTSNMCRRYCVGSLICTLTSEVNLFIALTKINKEMCEHKHLLYHKTDNTQFVFTQNT